MAASASANFDASIGLVVLLELKTCQLYLALLLLCLLNLLDVVARIRPQVFDVAFLAYWHDDERRRNESL